MNRHASDTARDSCLRRLGCAVAVLTGGLTLLCLGGVALAVVLYQLDPGLLSGDLATRERHIEALVDVLVADLGEDPHLELHHPRGALPVCRDVPSVYGRSLRQAFGLMRGTAEGRRLYALLVEHDICVGVAAIPYNAAYASARRIGDDWSASTIIVDHQYFRSLDADVLAAILVHEATHLDRAIAGTACWEQIAGGGDACTTLPNGVRLEEEIAAHTAEAEWWLAAYGADGKRFALGPDSVENDLLSAYRRGPAAFRAYVADIRSNPNEGKGI